MTKKGLNDEDEELLEIKQDEENVKRGLKTAPIKKRKPPPILFSPNVYSKMSMPQPLIDLSGEENV
jgi:hypothetical protein